MAVLLKASLPGMQKRFLTRTFLLQVKSRNNLSKKLFKNKARSIKATRFLL
jgi:hypothetical protein